MNNKVFSSLLFLLAYGLQIEAQTIDSLTVDTVINEQIQVETEIPDTSSMKALDSIEQPVIESETLENPEEPKFSVEDLKKQVKSTNESSNKINKDQDYAPGESVSYVPSPASLINKPYYPKIGFGLGMLTYYGDISKNQKGNGALLSRVAVNLYLDQKINDFLDLSLFYIYGKTGANESSQLRNINFLTDISALGVKGTYNFNHIIPPSRYITPYVSVGFESLEFLSKTDLYDANGNLYHYWSDGSIRSIDENDINASSAVRLERDYEYESDVRETSPDDPGKYKERTFAIPIGVGVGMELTEQFTFNLGTELHLTTTDLIDGITNESVGERKGSAGNDRLLYTNFSISYNINKPIKNSKDAILKEGDIMAMDMDGDGVQDFLDNCPETPAVAEVGEDGCPLDDDQDGVPNYRDDELNTPVGKMVKDNGVGYTDQDYLNMLAAYNNSGGGSADTVRSLSYSDGMTDFDREKFMVSIGEFKGGLPQDVAEELLSIPDVNTWEEGGITYITVGSYDNVPDALRRQIELGEEGFTVSNVVSSKSGNLPEKVTNTEDFTPSDEFYSPSQINDPEGAFVYRVQIGAFRNRLSKNIFNDVPGVIMVPFEDEISRFYSGSYPTFEEAAKIRIDMISRGYEGSFVSAFKNGKRVSLREAGVEFVPDLDKVVAANKANGKQQAISNDLIKFSVQIGAFKGEVPPEVLNVVLTLESLQRERTPEGLVRYFSGRFNSINEAERFKTEMIEKGLVNSIVIGRFKEQTITAQEALELQK